MKVFGSGGLEKTMNFPDILSNDFVEISLVNFKTNFIKIRIIDNYGDTSYAPIKDVLPNGNLLTNH